MPTILDTLRKNPFLSLLERIFKIYPQEFYLVGGFLRDIFLEKRNGCFDAFAAHRPRKGQAKEALPCVGPERLMVGEFKPSRKIDLDFAVSSSAVRLSRKIARRLKSGFVVLDKEHGSARIVYRDKYFFCNFDFTDFRGADIQEDLFRRDFTVNSMAVNLRLLKKAKDIAEILIDPYGGRKDILKQTIRVISGSSFPDDPLRIFRAFSLSAVLGFKIEPETIVQIKRHKKRITSCAFERISEELFKILNSENAFKTFSLMDSLSILDLILPEIKIMRGVGQGPYHHLDVYRHSLETLKQIEIVFSQFKRNKDIQDNLNEVISGTHTRRALVKFAAFLHDIGKPDALKRLEGKIHFHGHERIGRDMIKDISGRLRLSNDECSALSRIVFWHLRPGYLADMEDITRRASFRFFRDAQAEALSILLLSIADQRSTRGPLTRGADRRHHEEICLGLVKEFLAKKKEKKTPKLLNGNDLIKHLRLRPGPLIGKILTEVEEAQAAGEIHSKSQALELARKFIK